MGLHEVMAFDTVAAAEQRLGPLSNEAESLLPLAVDLDGTLLMVDVLHESFIGALLRQPKTLVRLLPCLLFEGRASFKRQMSELAFPVVETLPICSLLLDWLHKQRAIDRRLHLVTAADQSIANAVAARISIFNSVIGSDGARNLKGPEKAKLLQQHLPDGFIYAGDSRDDLTVFSAARAIVVVNASATVNAATSRIGKTILAEFPRKLAGLTEWLGALRLHQWAKNLLLLVPLVLGHRLGDPFALLRCTVGVLLLGLVASGTYVLNDLADLAADRSHAEKRWRAVAAGRIPALSALVVACGLIAAGLAGGVLLGSGIAAGLAVYLAVSLAYSGWLKAMPLIDTLTIAGLFTLRLALGVGLADVPFSPWLMSFSCFFFFSLAMSKRHCELIEAREKPGTALARRGWQVNDWPLTLGFGAAAAIGALQIMILFVANEALPSRLYATPAWLYVTPAALSVWLARIWLLAHRFQLRHDPVVFALRDPWSWCIGAVICAAVFAAL